MKKNRFLIRRQLLPDRVSEYVNYHQNVPEELMDIYRATGITDLSCFLCENDLVVYFEVDEEVYEREKENLAQNPVDNEWQTLMKTLNIPDFMILTYREVFRM